MAKYYRSHLVFAGWSLAGAVLGRLSVWADYPLVHHIVALVLAALVGAFVGMLVDRFRRKRDHQIPRR